MKKLITIFTSIITLAANPQTPYTGGNGSGYAGVASPITTCSFYFGGIADGAAHNNTAPSICPPYFGGIGDGYSSQSSGCIVILPFKRIIFYGEKETTRNVLHWNLSDGFQANYIDVEKSHTGNAYTKVGTVMGSTNAAHPYLFIDNDPFPDINFYRLRIIDWNNTVTYSHILVMKNGTASFMTIYPNPAPASATLYYQATRTIATRLAIYQYDGRIVQTIPIHVVKGANYINLDLEKLAAGLYFVSVGENEERVKLIVQGR
jgi:hypothetical protein